MESPRKHYGFGWRHTIAVLSFFAFFCTYALRVNMNVAIVAMVNQTALNEKNHVDKEQPAYCLRVKNPNVSVENSSQAPGSKSKDKYVEGSYVWTTEQQGFILSSFYYGYVVTQVPGGWAASRFGAKWVMGLCILGTSILTLFTPLAANAGVEVLIAIRVAEGLLEAVMFPAMHALLARWVPPLERSKIPAFVYCGYYVGTVVTFAGSGYLAASSLGWPSIFYVAGSLGCIWFIFWTIFLSNSPEEHRWISKPECAYIIDSINAEKSIRTQKAASCGDVPWLSFAKSLPFIATCVSGLCWSWSFYTILTDLPIYLRTILGFDIQANGVISSLPYLTAFFCQMTSSWFADLIRTKGWLSTTNVRKLFDCSGSSLNAIFLLSITFIGCNRLAVIVLICLATGVGSFQTSGSIVNQIDLAPVYAGILHGIANCIGTIAGFITPSVVGSLTDGNQTISAWSHVFYISVGLNLFSCIFYLIFASGELQPWASQKEDSEDIRETTIILSPESFESKSMEKNVEIDKF